MNARNRFLGSGLVLLAAAVCLVCTSAYADLAIPILSNPGFEEPFLGSPYFSWNPGTAGGWTYTSSLALLGSSGCLGGNATASSGYQFFAINNQGNDEICSASATLQNLTPGVTYTLSFGAKGWDIGSGWTADPFHVSLDGTDLSFSGNTTITPAITAEYNTYSTTFTATAPTATLTIADYGLQPGLALSFVDDLKLSLANPGANLVTNGSFETPAYETVTHALNETGAGWTFTSVESSLGVGLVGSGIDRGDPYGINSNSVPFSGDQQAFLQGQDPEGGTCSISQVVSGFVVGQQYQLSFQAEGMTYSVYASGSRLYEGNPFTVTIDGNPVTFGGVDKTLVDPSAAYEFYVSDPFTATSETMELLFADLANQPYYHVAVIDDVAITVIPEPASIILLIGAALAGGLLWLRRR
ncbi:MAG: PEP-CTERM sorting domain-containing protein [Pirellulales bacterium]|nr:PEP-CTERM sorting domain-containing protein [Pirellulales bacterium]